MRSTTHPSRSARRGPSTCATTMGFDGAIITDALDMEAVAEGRGIAGDRRRRGPCAAGRSRLLVPRLELRRGDDRPPSSTESPCALDDARLRTDALDRSRRRIAALRRPTSTPRAIRAATSTPRIVVAQRGHRRRWSAAGRSVRGARVPPARQHGVLQRLVGTRRCAAASAAGRRRRSPHRIRSSRRAPPCVEAAGDLPILVVVRDAVRAPVAERTSSKHCVQARPDTVVVVELGWPGPPARRVQPPTSSPMAPLARARSAVIDRLDQSEGSRSGRHQYPRPVEGVPERCRRGSQRAPRRRRRRVPRARRPVRLRQVDLAADDRRTRGSDGRASCSIDGRDITDAQPRAARHRDGVPELRAVPAHDGAQEHRLPAEARRPVAARDRRAGGRGGAHVAARSGARPQARAALGRSAPAGGDGHERSSASRRRS